MDVYDSTTDDRNFTKNEAKDIIRFNEKNNALLD